MISRSLLLVLLVLACLQSFTTAENANTPDLCCVRFQTRPIPVRNITAYKVTDLKCTKPGVIFTLQSGRELCADTGFNWVKKHMEKINQRLSNSQPQTEKPDKAVSTPSPSRNDAKEPDQCCDRFQTRPIPVRNITAYKVTGLRCPKPGVIFTLQSGHELCADPGFNWVKKHMEKINQRLSNSQTPIEKPDKPVSTASPSKNEPDKPVSTAPPIEKDAKGPLECCFRFSSRGKFIRPYRQVIDHRCTIPGVIFTINDSHQLCADHDFTRLKNYMDRNKQHLFISQAPAEDAKGPDLCCFRFSSRGKFIRLYHQVIDHRCTIPGVIFTLQNGRQLCADPGFTMKNYMDRNKQHKILTEGYNIWRDRGDVWLEDNPRALYPKGRSSGAYRSWFQLGED